MTSSSATPALPSSSSIRRGRDSYPRIWSRSSCPPCPATTSSTDSSPPGRRKRRVSFMSPSVAERATRRIRRPAACSTLARSDCSWRPRSESMKAWSSSTTTATKPPKSRGASFALRMNKASRDSGVIISSPRGSVTSFAFWPPGTSPCHLQTGSSTTSKIRSSRSYWSLISALSGLTQRILKAPSPACAACPASGRKAASVFPLAVEDPITTSASDSAMIGMARSWTSRSVVHPSSHTHFWIRGSRSSKALEDAIRSGSWPARLHLQRGRRSCRDPCPPGRARHR